MHPANRQLNSCSWTDTWSTAAHTQILSTEMCFLVTLPKIFRRRFKQFQWNSLKLWKLWCKLWCELSWFSTLFRGAEWRAPQCKVLNYDLQNNGTAHNSERVGLYHVPCVWAQPKGKVQVQLYALLNPALGQPLNCSKRWMALAHVCVLAAVILWSHCKPRAGAIGQFGGFWRKSCSCSGQWVS